MAQSTNISAYTVPWVTAGSKHGLELAMDWIKSKEEHIAVAGWATLSGLVAVKPDEELDMAALKNLMAHVQKHIHTAGNREKQAMNGFIIAVGSYVKELTKEAIAVATKIGTVTADMNGTACKIPGAIDYIKKVEAKGAIGKKKKILKC